MYRSSYNIELAIDENKSIIFNSFSRKFIVFSSKFSNQYNEILNNPNEFIKIPEYAIFIKDLISGGFIIRDRGEQLKYIKKEQKLKNDKSNLCFTIYTTLDCNYKCWYCVQNHKKIQLGSDMQNSIIKLIENKCQDDKIKRVSISWFGGEPFLNLDAITRISKALITTCIKNNIEYNCDFTTNASLINEDIIDTISPFNVTSFQITIDGSKTFHNKTKFNLEQNDAFDTTLNAIVVLANRLPKTDIFVRINYSGNNILDSFVDEIDQYLYSVKDKIYVFFRKIWQINETWDIRLKIRDIMIKLKNRGYNIVHDFDHLGLINCISEHENYYSIFPNGAVSKCANVDINTANGQLLPDGTIKLNHEDLIIHSVTDNCNNCKYFPICLGPCPRERIKQHQSEVALCKFDNDSVHEYFKNEILNYYYLNCESK